MITVSEKHELKRAMADAHGRVVLVPTMGALHAGHLSLIQRARMEAGTDGTVVVSIFVNPIQFDRADDLEAYPRPVHDDLAVCMTSGVDVVFMPTAEVMYAENHSTVVGESALSRHLCGESRAGHFDGVCTVCLKLFLLSGCEVAIFGEKDFQQLAAIRRMVRDLDVPVEIIGCPTSREEDGLAMSSRNVRLKPEHRADAPRIYRALREALAWRGSTAAMLEHVRGEIETSGLARIDYLTCVDAQNLEPVDTSLTTTKDLLLAVAVHYGPVRLIDHVRLPPRLLS